MAYKIKYGVEVNINSLIPNPWNVNKTTPRQQEAIAESLGEYGQVIAILCRKQGDKYQIIDGEHRYQELVKSGVKTAVINVIEDISDAHAKKLSIILNETRGYADRVDLGRLLDEIKIDMGDDLITALPYDPQELDQLIKASQYDWESFAEAIADPQVKDDPDGEDDNGIKLKVTVSPEVKEKLDKMADKKIKDKPTAYGMLIENLLLGETENE